MTEERKFVLPGEIIVDSMDFLPGKNCYREGNGIYAKKIGIVYTKGRVVEVVPLSGVYIPEVSDMIIGEVKEVQYSGWVIDINSPYSAYLPLSGVREYIDPLKTDLSRIYSTGDMIYGKVSIVSALKTIHISMQDPRCRKLRGGRIVKITSVKVPRLIGKQGSMINLIKERTGCRIMVGQNGLVWLDGENIDLAVEAIREVEEKSHIEGLTNHVEKMLGGPVTPRPPKEAAQKPAEKKVEQMEQEAVEEDLDNYIEVGDENGKNRQQETD
jgi:exosome complex component RRP4